VAVFAHVAIHVMCQTRTGTGTTEPELAIYLKVGCQIDNGVPQLLQGLVNYYSSFLTIMYTLCSYEVCKSKDRQMNE
jgi:hypothetical protein